MHIKLYYKNNDYYFPSILLQYFIILFIIFIVMLVGGILCYVFRQRVQTSMEQEMLRTIRFYGDDRTVTRAWDDLQEGVRLKIKIMILPDVDRNRNYYHYCYCFCFKFSCTAVASRPTTTGGNTGSAESFPVVVVKRSMEK